MLIKVCGLTESNNISDVLNLEVDMIGLNFYPKSKRYVNQTLSNTDYTSVGVFVDESLQHILTIAEKYQLNYIQLHGSESPEFTAEVAKHYPVIKAIGIETVADIKSASKYLSVAYILLDKKSPLHGGTGQKFDWSLIQEYNSILPFLLAGGINASDYNKLKEIDHPKFAGVDLNSQFEIDPGVKDKHKIRDFINNLMTSNSDK